MELLWTAWLLGLVGSLHCAGMCGPLALALPSTRGGSLVYVLGRLAYNGGRLVTYALLGFAFGLIGRTLEVAGRSVAWAGVQQWVSIALGVLLLVGLLLSPRAATWVPITRVVTLLKRKMGVALQRRGVGALAVLGLLNGLLPCGLVYVACVGALATGGWLAGALYMIVFGLGTVPMMLAISLSGKLVHTAMRRWLTRAMPVAVGMVALLLILRGLGLGIPYISPDFSGSGTAACCHPSQADAETAEEAQEAEPGD